MTLNYLIIGKRISTIRKERKLTQARLPNVSISP